MTGAFRTLGAVFLAGLLVGGLSACGGDVAAEEVTPASEIEVLDSGIVPGTLLDLTVHREDVSESLAGAHRSYVDGIGLYSIRDGELLQATLQVTRFNEHADVSDPDFRQRVLARIGGSVPRPVRVGEATVYLTTGTGQRLALWFTDGHLMVLGTREDFDRPRGLLRAALEVRP